MSGNRDQLDSPTIVALTLWTAVAVLAVVLAGRAITGAFDEPVAFALPLVVTVLTTVASLSAWTQFHRGRNRGDISRRLLDGLFAMALPAVAGFATSATATPITLAAVSAILVIGLTYVVGHEGLRNLATTTVSAAVIDDGKPATDRELAPLLDPLESEDFRETSVAPLCQQLTRRPLKDGGEEIEAVLIATFHAGERQTAVHLPIQPVMVDIPNVDCEPLDGSNVTVHPTSVHGFGIRIEVKRSDNLDQQVAIPIGLLITTTGQGESAA